MMWFVESINIGENTLVEMVIKQYGSRRYHVYPWGVVHVWSHWSCDHIWIIQNIP